MSTPPKHPLKATKLPIIVDDPYLGPFEGVIRNVMARASALEAEICKNEGSVEAFSLSYRRYGVHYTDRGMTVREWAPNAVEAAIVGEFNNWDVNAHRLTRDPFGTFAGDFQNVFPQQHSRIKIAFRMKDGNWIYRIPAYMNRVVKDGDKPVYSGVVYREHPFTFQHPRPSLGDEGLKIYECHIGMSSTEPKIASYLEFARDVLPRVKSLGYNAIQIMAVMEHAYYASFGYQVTSFFAPSSRFGTPEELKQLVDTAHSMGLMVLLDVVHSHASKNVEDGLNLYDGSVNESYFSGEHPLWDSRLFDYGRYETLRFLLSNLRMWVEEFRFDGFRFDGVTSMLYHHHGMGYAFGGYHDYFGDQLDHGAVAYLMLANKMLHELYPSVITIAEDVSGFPGLCRTFADGGVGFDYRLAMSLPDMWETLCGKVRDEDWNMTDIQFQLNNRRWKEKNIAYVESHDQALVGSKTVAFWLMDKEMYTHMSRLSERTPVIDRGLALHKMIRLLTHGLGGEGYLAFMGNEFGHPEWIDFPRAGNNDSYHYCRRRFDLADSDHLWYSALYNFDVAMNRTETLCRWLSSMPGFVSEHHNERKTLVFDRGQKPTVFAFNFHPTNSLTDFRIAVPAPGKYKVILHTDANGKAKGTDEKVSPDQYDFGGHGRIDSSVIYDAESVGHGGRSYSFRIYLPSRCGVVLSALP